MLGICFVGYMLLFSSPMACAMGKKYSEQGAKLTAAMNSALLTNGFCKVPRECHDLLPGTVETDSEILIHFYEISEKNYSAFLVIVSLTLTDGLLITSGIPVTVKAFHETHDEYRESGFVFKSVKPFVIIKVIR